MAIRKNIFAAGLMATLAFTVGCSESNTTAVPVDTVPPAIPSGIHGWADDAGQIELAWDANVSDVDFAGTLVYRSANGGASWDLLTLSAANGLVDGAVEAGMVYQYRLTSIDLSDNEIENFSVLANFPSSVQFILAGNPAAQGGPTTFLDLCILSRDEATPTGQTIRAMLDVQSSDSCAAGNAAILASTTLDLSGRDISDLRPLAALSHLTTLNLSSNAISDVAVEFR